MMIRSFNDVALALARDTAGSVPRFAQLMNAKARQMGMYNSRFANPNGLPADQYSTAIDMARCAYYVYRTRNCAILSANANMPLPAPTAERFC